MVVCVVSVSAGVTGGNLSDVCVGRCMLSLVDTLMIIMSALPVRAFIDCLIGISTQSDYASMYPRCHLMVWR